MADDTIVDEIKTAIFRIFTDVLGYNAAQDVTDPNLINFPFVSVWAQDASHTRDRGEKITRSVRNFFIRGAIAPLDGNEDEKTEELVDLACQTAVTTLAERATLWATTPYADDEEDSEAVARVEDSFPTSDTGFLPITFGNIDFGCYIITLEVAYYTRTGYGT